MKNMVDILQTTFSNVFFCMNFDEYITEVFPEGQIHNIPSLVHIMARLAIIWTNYGQFIEAYMCHSASIS